ncbi:MAG: hypothetical protein NZM38_02780 [Cytophagales bacterium]|nr:hypothetical protein [Cytophagales bacterium]MDW8383678.1 hypothetical protein [Flammeovirgaceae bacterium]
MEELISYVKNTLPEHQKRKVELAIAENPFLAEALEGIEKMKNPEDLKHIIETVHERFAISRKKIVSLWTYSGIAASLLLIAGLVWFFIASRKSITSETTQETSFQQTIQEKGSIDTTTKLPQITPLPPSVVYSSSKKIHSSTPSASVPNQPRIFTPTSTPESMIAFKAEESFTGSQEKVFQKFSLETEKKLEDSLALLQKYYNEHSYEQAIQLAEVLLSQYPCHPVCNYIAGSIYLTKNQKELAKNRLLLLFGQEQTETFAQFELKTLLMLVQTDKFEEAQTLISQYKWEDKKLIKQ